MNGVPAARPPLDVSEDRVALPHGQARATRLMQLAATPTFAAMGMLTALARPGVFICSNGPLAPLDSMTVMYLLMAIFHAPPWIRPLWRAYRTIADGEISMVDRSARLRLGHADKSMQTRECDQARL